MLAENRSATHERGKGSDYSSVSSRDLTSERLPTASGLAVSQLSAQGGQEGCGVVGLPCGFGSLELTNY